MQWLHTKDITSTNKLLDVSCILCMCWTSTTPHQTVGLFSTVLELTQISERK